MNKVSVRFAERKDSATILMFIKELAIYEKLEDQVTATKEDIEVSIFDEKKAEVLLLEEDGIAMGFALFFENYSTFLGKANIYLEDLYVNSDCRGMGYGKRLLQEVAKVALNRNCERLDWACLNWNESSISFYKNLDAEALEEWTTFRLSKNAMEALVKQAKEL